jgi:transposase InsO family protein
MSETKSPPDEDVALLRYLVVTQVCAAVVAGAGKTAAIREVARRPQLDHRGRLLNIGERTLWRWLAAWEEAGVAGLARAPREAQASSLPTGFLKLLVELKQSWPETSIPEVIRIARSSGVIPEDEAIDRTTVWRQCKRQGLPTRRRNAAKKDRQRPWRFPNRMLCVLADGKHFRAGAKRVRRVVVFFLDNATRFILAAVVGTSESAALALRGRRRVIHRWGLLSCLYVDHGFKYRDLMRASATLHIALILGAKAYPEGHGALERFNRTADEQLLCGWPSNPAIDPELAALERRVEHWAFEQYNHTPHEALDHDTPAQRFHADSRALEIPASEAAVDEAFVTSFDRRVTNHNCVSIDKVLWEIPIGHRGEKIDIFRNMITGTLAVQHDGERVQIQPVDLTSNAYQRNDPHPDSQPGQPGPRPTAADIAWDRDHPPLPDNDGNYRGDE